MISDWKRISDGPPESDGEYIVTTELCGHRNSYDAWYIQERFIMCDADITPLVIAWTPMPEPYKGLKDGSN